MKISELIKRLSEIQSEHGDLPVYGACNGGWDQWELEQQDTMVDEECTIRKTVLEDFPKKTFDRKFRGLNLMGTIRESSDPEMRSPSSWFGFGDLPEKADILLDDICQTVLTKDERQGFGELYTYDEIDALSKTGIQAMRLGKELKMRKSEMIQKLKELENYIENVSSALNQLTEELGYETHWEYQQCCHKSILKLKKKASYKNDPPESKSLPMGNEITVDITDGATQLHERFESYSGAIGYLIKKSQHQDFNFRVNNGEWERSTNLQSILG